MYSTKYKIQPHLLQHRMQSRCSKELCTGMMRRGTRYYDVDEDKEEYGALLDDIKSVYTFAFVRRRASAV